MAAHQKPLKRSWGQDDSGGSSPVRTWVKMLRRKFGEDAGSPTYIFTMPRVGFRMPRGEAQIGGPKLRPRQPTEP